jgi:acetyltransferase
MKNGGVVTIRPIRPEDEPMMAEFHSTLSDRTVYLRYFASLSLSARISHERLLRICFGDYEREMVLITEYYEPHKEKNVIIGVGRLNKLRGGDEEAEVAVLISDQYQRKGLGLELLQRVIDVARDEKLSRVSSEMLRDNLGMQVISKKLGFQLSFRMDSPSIKAILDL